MLTEKAMEKLTKERQERMNEIRKIGIHTSFAYEGNSTFCFLYDEDCPEAVKAYAQTIRCEGDENNPKFARNVAFVRAYKAMLNKKVRYFKKYCGDSKKSVVKSHLRETGSPGEILPTPISAKIKALATRYSPEKSEHVFKNLEKKSYFCDWSGKRI